MSSFSCKSSTCNCNYPSLYYSADRYSAKQQSIRFALLAVELISAIAVSVCGYASKWVEAFSWIQLILLIVMLLASLVDHATHAESKWYKARSLAESVKTLAWRYSMEAEPFNRDAQSADSLFRKRIKRLEIDNRELVLKFPIDSEASMITESMRSLRASSAHEKEFTYLSLRVDDQLHWYIEKGKHAKRCQSAWFWITTLLIISAIASCIEEMNSFLGVQLPLEAIVIAATSSITWVETKRFEELATAYSLTAREISTVKESFHTDIASHGLSSTVADAEKAFSREHAQWLSRKDF